MRTVCSSPQADLYLGLTLGAGKPATTRIELNKLPATTNDNGAPIPQRSVGDLRLSIDLGNTGNPVYYLHRWDGNAWQRIAIDASAITYASSGSTYFEFKFDLYKLLYGGSNGFECGDLTFSSAMIRAQAAAAETSNLKDYALGEIDLNFCGGIEIIKKNEDGELVGPATFRITPNPLPGGEGDYLDVTVNDENDANKAIGIISLPKVNSGHYTVEETVAPEGYLLPADRDQGPVTVKIGDTAEFTFVDPLKWQAPTVSKTAEASYDAEYAWSIEKDANETKFDIKDGDKAEVEYTIVVTEGAETKSEFKLSGEITVNNPNDKAMTVTLSDELADGTVCDIVADDVDDNADGLQVSLAAGDNVYPYTCGITAENADGKNTATVEWDNKTYPSEQAHVDDEEAGTSTATGSDEYKAEVTKTHETVDVYDQFTSPEEEARKLNEEPLVWSAEGKKHTYTYKRDFVGTPGECTSYDNTAQVKDEGTVIDEDNEVVEVCVSKGPESAKGATGSFTRDFDWKVTKSVVEDSYTVEAGEQVNPDYTVTAEVEKVTDSDIKVIGEIEVTNPNNYGEALTATVTDQLYAGEEALEGAVCKVEGEDSHQVAVAAGATETVTYECVLDELPEGEIVNHAKVAWPNEQASVAKADVAFEGTYVDTKVVVTDDKTIEGESNELGTVEVNKDTGEIEGENTFTYNDVALTGPAADSCETFVNTAVVDESTNKDENNTDTAKVEVCANPEEVVPTPTPTPEPTPEPTKEPKEPLADTGAQVAGIAIGGALLIGAGLAALVWSRRRALEG